MVTNDIKVVSITFPGLFRKINNLTVEFANRLTLIAGHNGIGKSTILALTTNTFGLTQNPKIKSYFDQEFYCSIEQMMHIDLTEVDSAQQVKALPPRVTCIVNGITITKECSLTRRTEHLRARVVPRSLGKNLINAGSLEIGPDAKIPLPTIHLGIRRMLPAGEVPEKDVISNTDTGMHQEDCFLIANFINSVVLNSNANENITSLSFKGARKVSNHPGYIHDPRSISLGQDSLGSIATALASFNRIKREMQDDYPGGLLVIDELDAGFHPHAIGRLAEALKTNAKKLNIQIIATTHSPRLIEAIHPEGDGNAQSPDAVVYMLDTKHPRLAPDQSLHAILSDMNLYPVQIKKSQKLQIPIYFEDEEAAQFFGELLPSRGTRAKLARKHNVKLVLLPLGVGGSNLLNLPKHDPHFLDTILIVDADTSLPHKNADRAKNMVKLPGALDKTGKGMSPERTIKKFIEDLADSTTDEEQEILLSLNVINPTTDLIRSHFLTNGRNGEGREALKKWWIAHWSDLKSWGVIAAWGKANPDQVNAFMKDTDLAIIHVSNRQKSSLAK